MSGGPYGPGGVLSDFGGGGGRGVVPKVYSRRDPKEYILTDLGYLFAWEIAISVLSFATLILLIPHPLTFNVVKYLKTITIHK